MLLLLALILLVLLFGAGVIFKAIAAMLIAAFALLVVGALWLYDKSINT